MATNIGTAFFNVTFNTAAARREVTALVSHMNRSFGLLTGVAVVATTAAIAGLVKSTAEIGAAALGAANDYEQAFASVRKTLDDGSLNASQASTVFEQLNADLRDLALETPLDLEDDLATVAALGGQLGIPAGEIREFTEVVSELGVTTNIAVEDVATGIARLGNIMGVPTDQFRDLGDAIVNLGNNLPAQEDEILRFSLRIAAAGEIVGFTSDEVLSLSGAMASVGVPAERGGTAIQRTMIKIEQAVTTGSDSLRLFGAVSGLTATEFATLWEKDASEAFTLFVEGLGRSGSQAFGILDQLELAEQRTLQALLSIANAGPLLRDSFQLGADAAGSLATESGIFFDTTTARIKLLQNAVNDAGITIGEQLQEPFRDLIGAATDWIQANPQLIEAFGGQLADVLADLVDLLVDNQDILENLLVVLPQVAQEALDFARPFVNIASAFLEVAGAFATFKAEVESFGDEGTFQNALAGIFDFATSSGLDIGGQAMENFEQLLNFTDLLNEAGTKAHGIIEQQIEDADGWEKALLQVELGFVRVGNVLTHLPAQAGEGGQFLLGQAVADAIEAARTGEPEIRAASNALLDLQNNLKLVDQEISPEGFFAIAEALELDEAGMRAFAQRAHELGVILPPIILEMLGLRNVTDSWMNLWRQDFSGSGLTLPTFGFDFEEGLGPTPEEIEAQAKAYQDALTQITDATSVGGISTSEFINNIGRLAPELAPIVEGMGPAATATDLFAQSMTNLKNAIDFGGVDQLFEVDLLNNLEEASIHGSEIIANLEEQAAEFAEFEANLVILAARGFDDLVAELIEAGPGARHAAEDFVTGVADPLKAENLLEDGGTITAEVQATLIEALAGVELTPEILDLVAQFTSVEVMNAVYAAGLEYGERNSRGFKAAWLKEINELPNLIPELKIPASLVITGYSAGEILDNNQPPPPPPPPSDDNGGSGANQFSLSFLSSGTSQGDAVRAAQILNALVV